MQAYSIWVGVWLLGVATVGVAEPIYKSRAADGSIEYSDQARPGAEPLILREPTVVPADVIAPTTAPLAPRAAASGVNPYTALAILSPPQDANFLDVEGKISVVVALTPSLRQGDKFVAFIDGTPMGEFTTTTFVLENIDRGTHVLTVAVVSREGQTRMTSPAITVHLQRPRVKRP